MRKIQLKNQKKNSKLTQKQTIYSPKFIFGTTFVVWAFFMVDSVMQHNGIIINILLSIIFWSLGFIAYRTTQQPGSFTRRVAKVGFWKAIFGSKSNIDNRDARARRNHR